MLFLATTLHLIYSIKRISRVHLSKCNVIIVGLKCRTIGRCIDVTWTNQINVPRGNEMLTIEEAQIMQ